MLKIYGGIVFGFNELIFLQKNIFQGQYISQPTLSNPYFETFKTATQFKGALSHDKHARAVG